jgi:hypothetical protein
MTASFHPPATRPLRRRAMLPVLAAAALVAACAQPPQPLHSVALVLPPNGLPAMLAVLPAQDAAFVPPPLPTARGGVEVAGRAAAATVLYPIAGAVLLPLFLCGPAAVVCIPLAIAAGAATGVGAGVGEGVSAANQDVHTSEEVAAAGATIRRLLDPARIGDCLRITLVGRSGGRLVTAPARASGSGLDVGLGLIALSSQRDTPMRGSNPPLVLHLGAFATLRTDTAAPPAGGSRGEWRWTSEPRRYFAATAEEGSALQGDIEVAVGMLAQRMLADLYPGKIAPPTPRQGADEQGMRASCPGLAPAAAARQSTAAEGIAPRR